MTEDRNPVGRLFGAIVPLAVDAVDVDELISKLDVDALMERVDVDALLTRIDIDALLERIDIEALLGRIDLGALIGRIDMNELIAQVDLNAVLDDLDIKALVDKAGIDQIVAEASTGIMARTLDLARRQLVGLDIVIMGAIDRLFRRGRVNLAEVDEHHATGRPAGPISRLLAFGADLFLVSTIFSLVTYFGKAMIELFTGDAIQPTNGTAPLLWGAAYFLWFGFYLWASVEIAGKTPGKALVGLRIVGLDGQPLGPGRALLRTIAFPFSFILGLGFIPAITRRDRRALHELVAGCQEVVDWGTRDAGLPSALEGWIERQRAAQLKADAKAAAASGVAAVVASVAAPVAADPAEMPAVVEPTPVDEEPPVPEVADVDVDADATPGDAIPVDADGEGGDAEHAERTEVTADGASTDPDYWAS